MKDKICYPVAVDSGDQEGIAFRQAARHHTATRDHPSFATGQRNPARGGRSKFPLILARVGWIWVGAVTKVLQSGPFERVADRPCQILQIEVSGDIRTLSLPTDPRGPADLVQTLAPGVVNSQNTHETPPADDPYSSIQWSKRGVSS